MMIERKGMLTKYKYDEDDGDDREENAGKDKAGDKDDDRDDDGSVIRMMSPRTDDIKKAEG